jgi:hypothetical protein
MSGKMAIEEIQGTIERCTRRLLVLGPPRSRRLACIRKALMPLGIKPVVIDLRRVRSRQDLDSACKRAGRELGFWDAMIGLEREAKWQRLAIVFHNLDACAGTPGEGPVVDMVWMEAKNRLRGCVAIFTARDANFVARCFGRYTTCRSFIHQISLFGVE